jgi:hypothetical protein
LFKRRPFRILLDGEDVTDLDDLVVDDGDAP